MSIKTKLLIFTLSVALIPIFIITTVYYLNSRSVLINQELQELIAIVEAKRIHIMSFMEAKEGRVKDFSSDGFIRDHLEIIAHRDTQSYDVSSLNRHLKANKKPLDNHIASIAVLDINGKVVASTTEKWIGRDMSEDDIFQECKSKNYGETYTGKSFCIPYININVNCLFISVPLTSIQGNKTIGVIINAYDLGSLNEITSNRIGMGETGEVYIVNRDKIMITESRFIENAVLNQVVDTEPVRKIVESGSGMSGIYADYRGVPIVGASANIPEYGWILLAEMDKAEAFAHIVRMRIFTIIMGCIIVIVVITISIMLSNSLTKPIHKLVEGTRRITKGDLAFRIEILKKDEIGQLATSFNDMVFQLGESKKQLQDYALNLEEKVEDKTKEMERREEYIESLIETAQDAIVCDINQSITEWNKSAERIFGYSKREVLGQPVSILIPEEYRKEHDEGLKRFLKTGKSKIIGKTLEVSGITKKGLTIPLEISITHQKLGNEQHLFTAIIRDIRKRQKLFKALQLSEEKYKTLVQTVPDIIYTIDVDGCFTFVNDSIRILGYEPEELIGKHFNILLHPHDVELFSRVVFFNKLKNKKIENNHNFLFFDEIRTRNRMTKRMEIRLLRKVQEKRRIDSKETEIPEFLSCEVTATGYYEKDYSTKHKKLIGTLGIARDISEKLKIQAEAIRMEQLVMVGEMAAGLSHEINNPINGIINCAQLIMDESSRNSKSYNFSKIIIDESKRIATLTENLLLLSRKTDGQKSHVQIYDILYNSLSLMMMQLKKDNIIVKFNISKDIPAIYGSSQEIQQVFLNLMQNARYALNEKNPGKYMGKTLEISCNKISIGNKQYVRIIFHDQGIGIPENVLGKATNPFYTTKPLTKGTGLGLSICQRIIEDHDGQIVIESVEGEFTRVIIDLPVTK